MKSRPRIPEQAMNVIRQLGATGGKARAERHTAEELSAWGKLGGRPKKNAPKAKEETK